MPKLGFSFCHIHLDRNRVQPMRGVFQTILAEIPAENEREAPVFGTSDSQLWMRWSRAPLLARFHLDKSDFACTLFAGDNVQLSDSVSKSILKIHIQDSVTISFQVIRGDDFASPANFFILLPVHCFHYSRIGQQKNRLFKADLLHLYYISWSIQRAQRPNYNNVAEPAGVRHVPTCHEYC